MFDIDNKDKLYFKLKSVLKTELIPTKIWQASGHDGFRPAAVLTPLFWKKNQIHVLLTKRSEQLKHHAGQVSFPGGGFDKNDITIRQAAIRETEEEIGIQASHIEVVGYLDDIETSSGFYVTPFVGMLKDGFKVKINHQEVSEVFSVPLSFFCDVNNRQTKSANYRGEKLNYYVYEYNGYMIWGITAEIIVQFVNKIKNK